MRRPHNSSHVAGLEGNIGLAGDEHIMTCHNICTKATREILVSKNIMTGKLACSSVRGCDILFDSPTFVLLCSSFQ